MVESSSITYIAPKFGALAFKQDRLAGDGHGVLDARELSRGRFFDLLHHRSVCSRRGRVGQLHVDQQIALVLRGDEAGGGLVKPQ